MFKCCSDSSVWGKLEAALISKKLLHLDITCALYLRYCPALEREVLRVLEQYVGIESQGPWWQDRRLGISHFKPHGRLLHAKPWTRERSKARTPDEYKVNRWADSLLVEASGHTGELFARCLELLGNILQKTHFSFSAVVACRDYVAQVCVGLWLYCIVQCIAVNLLKCSTYVYITVKKECRKRKILVFK